MGNGDDFLSQIIAAWLTHQDNVLSQCGEPTWSVLADKLEEIGCSEIAGDIQRKHDGPQHGGESEQQESSSSVLSADASNSLMDDQLNSTSLLDAPCNSYETITPISMLQPVIESTQDQARNIIGTMCFEEPPVPKRTKLDQQSIREHSSNQQLLYTTNEEQNAETTYTYTMGKMFSPIVTVPITVAESFSHHTSDQTQLIEEGSLQRAVSSSQAMKIPLPPPPTPTCSLTTVSALSHQAATPPVVNSSHNHPNSAVALPNTVYTMQTESVSPEEAGEAFREYRADLLEVVVDPLILANHLYSKKIISRETLKQITELSLTVSNKTFVLLDAVEARIRTHSSDFLSLLAILGNDAHLCVYAERLWNSYCQLCTQRSLCMQPTNSSAIMKLNMYLMNCYKSSQGSLDTKFPHLQEKSFISLAVIEKESVSRANADSFTRGTLHGHADEILKKKRPIEFESVLEPPEGQESIKCVFVEGAPGVGKSTFALELCRRQEGSRIYSLVVLLRLREKRVQEIHDTVDLFCCNPDLQQAVTKEVITCEGKNVLFVLDGFDELPAKLRYNSFIVKLIQGKHLPASTVVVTSRPSATADLLLSCKSQINKRIEVLGFTHKRIIQYAESMLSDQPDMLEDFLKYISNNPAIHGMMYIPLNSAIVLEIYKDSRTINRPVPHTLTQLYMELCLVLLRKYLTEKCDPLIEQVHETFEDLPKTLKDQLIKLGRLAFEGAKREEITFKQLPDGCDDLGFMNVSTELYLGRKSASYSFLHLTLQEFLAALYISHLPDVEQKLLYIENNDLLYPKCITYLTEFRKIIAKKRACDLDVMWRFMAGLTEFKNVGWKVVHKAIQIPLCETKRRLHYPPLLIQTLFEVHTEQAIKAACDAICEDVKLINRYVVGELEREWSFIDVHAMSLFDCYAVGYCVAASNHEWYINLAAIGGDEVVRMFGCGLQCFSDIGGYFIGLDLSRNSLTHQAMTYVNQISPKVLNKIKALDLSNNQLDSVAMNSLSNAIPNMGDLIDFSIANNPIGSGGMVKFLGTATNIYCLDLIETKLGPSDIRALSQLMGQSTNLKDLKIGDKDMSVECVTLLVETVLSPASVEDVELWWLQFTAESASKFKLLENNSHLSSLEFINCPVGLDLTVPYVAKALHKNESLEGLGIPSKGPEEHILFGLLVRNNECNIDIGKSGVRALSEMLKVNKGLKHLCICTKNLNDDDVQILISALKENSTLENLGFHHQIKLFNERLYNL